MSLHREEDYRRPAREEQSRKESEARLLERASPESRKALEELLARPVNAPSPEYLTQSVEVLLRARALLHASTPVVDPLSWLSLP
jgi:hypothetical protein